MLHKIECVTALDAEKVPVDPSFITICPTHDGHSAANRSGTEGGCASVSAMCADRRGVLHLPWARLISVWAGSKCTDRADINAHSAFLALQMLVLVGHNQLRRVSVGDSQCPDIHSFSADSDAAVAHDAPRSVEVHNRRPLLLIAVIFYVHQPRLCRSVGVCGILKLALTARIAHRAVKRVILQNKLQHGLPALSDRWAFRCDDHAFSRDCCTRSLQLWRFCDLHKTHTAGSLEGET